MSDYQTILYQIYEHLIGHYKPMIKLFRTVEKPIIAAINGVAAGAGASLALACDLRIMAKNASLLQAFSNIGLIPDSGSTWFLVRQVGYSRAFELAIEGERIPAVYWRPLTTRLTCNNWLLRARILPKGLKLSPKNALLSSGGNSRRLKSYLGNDNLDTDAGKC